MAIIVKINFIKKPYTYLYYVPSMFTKYEKNPSNTVGVVAKKLQKWLSLKGHNSLKIDFSSIKNPHAHLQYVHNLSAKFEKHAWKL